jgi:hypothetical protein
MTSSVYTNQYDFVTDAHRFYLRNFERWLLEKDFDKKEDAKEDRKRAFDLMCRAQGARIEDHRPDYSPRF